MEKIINPFKVGDIVKITEDIKDAYGEVWYKAGDELMVIRIADDGEGIIFDSDLGIHCTKAVHAGNEQKKPIEKKKLTQEVFKGMPSHVNWAGVDYDGTLKIGTAINPRYTWASEAWRGYEKQEIIEGTDFQPLTSIRRDILDIKKKELEEKKELHKSMWDTYGSELCAGGMIAEEEKLKEEIKRIEQSREQSDNIAVV